MSEPQTTQPAPPPVFSPKDLFLSLESSCQAWRNVARNSHTVTALTYALAEYATDNPTSEQLAGVQNFIKVLLNLAEPKPPPRGSFPERRLVSHPESEPTKGEDKKK